jgi:hypothetical protein
MEAKNCVMTAAMVQQSGGGAADHGIKTGATEISAASNSAIGLGNLFQGTKF